MTNANQHIEFDGHFRACITGEVQHRGGDGPLELIPMGQVIDVVPAIASMVVSWQSDGQPVNGILSNPEFAHYLATGAIAIVQGPDNAAAAA